MQIMIFLPMLIFTVPGLLAAVHKVISVVTAGSANLSNMYVIIGVIAVFALFFAPFAIAWVAYVVGADYENINITFKTCIKSAMQNYKAMLSSYLSAFIVFVPVLLVAFTLQFNLAIALLANKIFNAYIVLPVLITGVVTVLYLLGTAFLPYIVVKEKTSGFRALLTSFKYIYLGNFLKNFVKMLFCALLMGGLSALKGYISSLPVAEVIQVYFVNPTLSVFNRYFPTAIGVAVVSIIVTAVVLPFWYAFSYNTYKGAKLDYQQKRGIK